MSSFKPDKLERRRLAEALSVIIPLLNIRSIEMLNPISKIVAALLLINYGVHRLNPTFNFRWFWWNLVALGVVIILETIYYNRQLVKINKPAPTPASDEQPVA